MGISVDNAANVLVEADCLYAKDDVNKALDAMAGSIQQRLATSNPIVLCVMTGGIIPTGKLLVRLDFPLQVDYVHVTRYQEQTKGGEISWVRRQSTDVKGRSVLVVDDILDEGITLAAIRTQLAADGAKEVLVAVLVDKLHNRKHGPKADFVGLTVPDRYVFGYGMDYKGYHRNVRGIYAVKGL